MVSLAVGPYAQHLLSGVLEHGIIHAIIFEAPSSKILSEYDATIGLSDSSSRCHLAMTPYMAQIPLDNSSQLDPNTI